MVNANFQDRLNRIGDQEPQYAPDPAPSSQGRSAGTKGFNVGLFVVGSAVFAIAGQLVKYANANYETIRETSGPGAAAGLGLASLLSVLVAIYLMSKAVSRKQGVVAQQTLQDATQKPKATRKARTISSLLGFALGVVACLYVVMASAARDLGTEQAVTFANGGILIAMALALLSILLGIVGLFLRRLALGRVPIYFFIGLMITYFAVRLSGLSITDWQQFLNLA